MSNVSRKQRQRIVRFSQRIQAIHIAGVRIDHGEVGRPTHPGRAKRVGSFAPPEEFQLAERLADLELALERRDWNEAMVIFRYLKRVLGY